MIFFNQMFLGRLKTAARKSANLSMACQIIQGPDELPTALLDKLFEAYQIFTPTDPDAPPNQKSTNTAFVMQVSQT